MRHAVLRWIPANVMIGKDVDTGTDCCRWILRWILRVLWFSLKALLAVGLLLAALFVAGLTGLSFWLWPTSFNDSYLQITPRTIELLQELKAERKFLRDEARFYPGAPNDVIRGVAQLGVDTVIEGLLVELPHNPRRSVVLGAFKAMLPTFERLDSEEKDQVLFYFERVMSVVGVASSGELLNVWRYGFPYGWFVKT